MIGEDKRARLTDANLALSVKDVSKTYGGIKALRRISFDVRKGEIRALLGENGAGKSTILKILCGVAVADEGSVTIAGRTFTAGKAIQAKDAGVAMIFQEMSLIPYLSVAQNIFLTREKIGAFGLVNDAVAERAAGELFDMLGVKINPRSAVGRLSAGQRQLTEIAKAVSQNSRVLILDEPTTALSEAEVGKLFDMLKRLKDDGVSIIYVSHRMDEIFRVADSVTILRDGEHVTTAPLSALTMEQLIEKIIGKKSRGLAEGRRDAKPKGDPILSMRNVRTRKLKGASFVLHKGEILGIAGLTCSGRSAVARALFGIDPIESGEVFIRGQAVAIGSPGNAMALGVALVPEDRLREGIVRDHSVADNIVLPSLRQVSRLSWLSKAAARSLVGGQIERLRIKARSPSIPLRALSGGNQQKAVIAKWLARQPEILLLDEPTAGIDIGSKAEILALLHRLASEGMAIVIISSELSELLAAADRIVIMNDGRLVRDYSRSAFDMPPEELEGNAEIAGYAERMLNRAIQGAARAVLNDQ